MKILVTGGRGQLGHAIQRHLQGHQLFITDVPELSIFDLISVEKALHDIQPDLLLNAAAYTNVDGAESHKEEAFQVNAEGPLVLAKATGKRKIPLVHLSTDYVFDGTKKTPYTEDDETHPVSVYGASKLAGEIAVRDYNPQHFIVRTAWLYYVAGKNFPKTMIELAKNKSEIRVVNDQFGCPTYAAHLVTGLVELITQGIFGTYHMAGSGQTTWFGFASRLFKEMGLKTIVKPVAGTEFPKPAPRPVYSVLQTIRRPAVVLPSWEEGVRDFVELFGKHAG